MPKHNAKIILKFNNNFIPMNIFLSLFTLYKSLSGFLNELVSIPNAQFAIVSSDKLW